MKNLIAGLSLFCLASCVYAGNVSIWPWRNNLIERYNSIPIEYYNGDEVLVKSEYITEKNFQPNQILTAYVGYSVVDLKTYRKDFYKSEYVRPAMNGVLNSASIPVAYKKSEKLKIVGEVVIDGERYALIPTNLPDFVVLSSQNGVPGRKIGQIRNGRLVLLDSEFIAYPADFHFEPVTSSRSEQTEPVKGFDIKYDGVKLDRMIFTYYDYANSQGDSGRFENLSFPNRPGVIDIYGIGIKVLHAGNQKLDYIILPR